MYPPDPVNDFDLDGNFTFTTKWKIAAAVGATAVGVGAACYFSAGLGCGAAVARGASWAGRAAIKVPAKNISQKLTMETVRANPKIGREIMKGAIKDNSYKRILGWRKMQYTHQPLTAKGSKVTVHYFYNIFTKSARQLKVK